MKFTKDLFLDKRGSNATGNNDGTSSDPLNKLNNSNASTGLQNAYNGWNNTYHRIVTTAYPAMWYCRGKNGVATEIQLSGEGWYLPSQSEAIFFWIIAPAIAGYAADDGTVISEGGEYGFSTSNYWSSTEVTSNNISAWGVNHFNTPAYAVVYNEKVTTTNQVRCVKAY